MYEQNARSAVRSEAQRTQTSHGVVHNVSENYSREADDYDSSRRAMFESSRARKRHSDSISRLKRHPTTVPLNFQKIDEEDFFREEANVDGIDYILFLKESDIPIVRGAQSIFIDGTFKIG